MNPQYLALVFCMMLLPPCVWICAVWAQVDSIRGGFLDKDAPEVIGAARWWVGDQGQK